MLQAVSVFSDCCCLPVKLCVLIKPSEEQTPVEWLIIRPTLAFYTWHLLQPLLCFAYPSLHPRALHWAGSSFQRGNVFLGSVCALLSSCTWGRSCISLLVWLFTGSVSTKTVAELQSASLLFHVLIYCHYKWG